MFSLNDKNKCGKRITAWLQAHLEAGIARVLGTCLSNSGGVVCGAERPLEELASIRVKVPPLESDGSRLKAMSARDLPGRKP
jgi:hypothetical protein